MNGLIFIMDTESFRPHLLHFLILENDFSETSSPVDVIRFFGNIKILLFLLYTAGYVLHNLQLKKDTNVYQIT